jgi:cyclic-di-AMP phosphodiesterase PgpH
MGLINGEWLKKYFGFFSPKFYENELGRLLLGLIAWLSLTTFIHFREIKVETLELDTTAGSYVVAQVDFEFPDEEAMVILKQEAVSDIGSIYQIDDKNLRQSNYDFEYSLIHNSGWREELPGVTLDDVYRVLDGVKIALKEDRFVDSITKAKMNKLQLDTLHFFVFPPSSLDKKVLPPSYWELLQKKIGSGSDEAISRYIISFFQKRTWPLEEDKKASGVLRDLVENSVPQKYTTVKAGTKIITEGEKVRSRHIAMLKAMKDSLNEKRNLWAPFTIMGNLLLSLIFIIVSALYLKVCQKEVFRSLQQLSLLVCIFILTLAFAKVLEYILLQNPGTMADGVHYPLIIPFTAILVLIFFNPRLSLFCVSILCIILSIVLAVDHARFLIINLVTSLVIIVTTEPLRRRKEVFEVCGKSLIGALPIIFAFHLISKSVWSYSFINDAGLTILFLVLTAILVVGLLPILESLFNVMTDITLMEYMDPNNELLRRLTLEMPGTYQHSLVLGNLAETAAQAINANALLCRVATLYHDIGKLHNPHFFSENQQAGINIHQLLTPQESAQVIISHVKDGVMLAKKYRLPQSFIDIMQQHHGTMLVYFFYRKEIELRGGDASKIDESNFRYPGPKPLTKEAAIIMIADGVEAASRSLEEPTEEHLLALIKTVINDREDDGQFDDCNLTFKELGIIKKTLARTLIVTRHVRVKYPEKREELPTQ